MRIASIIFLLILLFLCACSNQYVEQEESEQLEHEDIESTDGEIDVLKLSEEVLIALANKEMESVASIVDEEKGLLFSPYLYIHEDALVFSKKEVETFFERKDVLNWGHYDGSGFLIELTTEEYYEKFIYSRNFLEHDEVVKNKIVERGNIIDNFDEVFEEYQFVEYFIEGTEEFSGMDWESLYFVFDTSDDTNPKLIAIVHNQWTI